jgi:hypothetical protein
MSIAHRREGLRIARRNGTSAGKARVRRDRALAFESLERRALLASLQFNAKLGEQSTLDSVAKTANFLPDVNNSGSQKFDHTDGTAVSNVTLTTGPSKVGTVGVNLDILSNGSVAKKGDANTAVKAGLADSTNTIGSGVPVMIVATDPSEKVGDPVKVLFDFTFNVDLFASNSAGGQFAYSVQYTYQGTTTRLGSASYSLGGAGFIRHIGPGPMDHLTGALNAHIGDTFTLVFSEQLNGQTLFPDLVAGINNVGWSIHTSLDASLVQPKRTDLSVSLDTAHVVPTDAPDLNLLEFFGTEKVTVPVLIKNLGPGIGKGTATITVSLSTTPDLKSTQKLGQVSQQIDLAPGASTEPIPIDVTIPSTLEAGQKYYVVAKLTSTIQETDDNGGDDANNVQAPKPPFEFVGTPTKFADVFTSGTYFNFIRDTLKAANGQGQWAVQIQAAKQKPPITINDLNDGMAFVKVFEGDKLYAYNDSAQPPNATIGVGINLATIDRPFPKGSPDPLFTLQQHLAQDVIRFYADPKNSKTTADKQQYQLIKNDTGVNSYKVVQLLESQANAGAKKVVLTSADDQALFGESYGLRQQAARKVLTSKGVVLKPRELITPIDQLYNSKGGIFLGMLTALQGNDFIRAGFEVVNSKNVSDSLTNANLRGLGPRMEAEFQNLVAGHIKDLGQIIKP